MERVAVAAAAACAGPAPGQCCYHLWLKTLCQDKVFVDQEVQESVGFVCKLFVCVLLQGMIHCMFIQTNLNKTIVNLNC